MENPSAELTLEQAVQHWPEMGQQGTFIGLKHCPTKFQIYWNGAISCFVGIDCFGNIFPTQKYYAEQYLDDQLHLTFGYGTSPQFNLIDNGQVKQSLLKNYLPITITEWQDKGFRYELISFATALNPAEFDNVPEQTLCLTKIKILKLNDSLEKTANLWLSFSGYKCLIWPKEQPEDSFPEYKRTLQLEENIIIDENNKIRLTINAKSTVKLSFFETYLLSESAPAETRSAERKGLLKNLLQLAVPLPENQDTEVILILPYFPISIENAHWLSREFDKELEIIINYWDKEYQSDTKIVTPEPFINDFYKAGLQHIYITTDEDKETRTLYAKSSPAWYETIWSNLAIATAIGLDYR
ncbi:MAG: hypothetical protein QME64_13220, partial [bacterium]|nr:hypothetical protein [bacterium]